LVLRRRDRRDLQIGIPHVLKRLLLVVAVASSVLLVHAQNATTDYIENLPEDAREISSLPIVEVTEDSRGAIVVLGSRDRPVSIRLLEPIRLETLESILAAVRRASLLPGTYTGPGWSLSTSDLDVNVGSNQTALIVPTIDEYSVRLNDEAVLVFSRRLTSSATFRYDGRAEELFAELEFDGIRTVDADSGAFPGWDTLSQSLLEWAQSGLDTNDQRVMGTILEIRVLSPVEAEQEKQSVVASQSPEETWARFGITSLAESGDLVSSSADGISVGFPSILVQTTARWDFLRFGQSPDIAPINLAVGIGAFADISLACLAECPDPAVTQWLGYGAAIVAGYSRVTPNIEGGLVEDPRLALGFELQLRINVATIISRGQDQISPLYQSEYYGTASLMRVISPFLRSLYRPEFLVGPQFRVLPNQNAGGAALYSMGLGIGIRMRSTIREYTRPSDEQSE